MSISYVNVLVNIKLISIAESITSWDGKIRSGVLCYNFYICRLLLVKFFLKILKKKKKNKGDIVEILTEVIIFNFYLFI